VARAEALLHVKFHLDPSNRWYLDFSCPRPFVPKNELSLWGTFVPESFRSQELSFPGTFVLGSPGTFVPWTFRSEEAYTTQHRTVLIIFPVILQTITIAQMMSAGEEGEGVINKERLSLLDMVGRQPTLLMPVTTSGATSSILSNVGSSQFHEG